jgi:ketosteroid isomerase-like protein
VAEDPNVAFLRDLYADWARGDYARGDVFDANVEFVTDFPERRTYRGPLGVRQGWTDFLSAWNDFTTEAEEILPVAPGRYLVLVQLRATGKESGVPIKASSANIVNVRDGRIARLELVFDRAAALEAVGLSRS